MLSLVLNTVIQRSIIINLLISLLSSGAWGQTFLWGDHTENELERIPSQYPIRDCAEWVMTKKDPADTVTEGESEEVAKYISWQLEKASNWAEAAQRQCGDGCAYSDTGGLHSKRGFYCFPKADPKDPKQCCVLDLDRKTDFKPRVGLPSPVQWNYTSLSNWSQLYPKDCGRKSGQQSPVNLVPAEAKQPEEGVVEEKDSLEVKGFNRPLAGSLTDNGEVLMLMIDRPHDYTMKNGHLEEAQMYSLGRIDFHFPATGSENGSEHSLNGVKFPLEMQMLFFNKRESDIATALTKYNKIAVISLMFEIAEEPSDNEGFPQLMGFLHKWKRNQKVEIPPLFDPAEVFGPTMRYVHYMGSMTKPPCKLGVNWAIFTNKLKITEKQLKLFQEVEGAKNTTLGSARLQHDVLEDTEVTLVDMTPYTSTSTTAGSTTSSITSAP